MVALDKNNNLHIFCLALLKYNTITRSVISGFKLKDFEGIFNKKASKVDRKSNLEGSLNNPILSLETDWC